MCCLLKKKISKEIGILYRLRNAFPLKVLKALYKSRVLSYVQVYIVNIAIILITTVLDTIVFITLFFSEL